MAAICWWYRRCIIDGVLIADMDGIAIDEIDDVDIDEMDTWHSDEIGKSEDYYQTDNLKQHKNDMRCDSICVQDNVYKDVDGIV